MNKVLIALLFCLNAFAGQGYNDQIGDYAVSYDKVDAEHVRVQIGGMSLTLTKGQAKGLSRVFSDASRSVKKPGSMQLQKEIQRLKDKYQAMDEE